MAKLVKILGTLFLFASSLAWSSQDIPYGEQVKNFVEQHAREISDSHLHADLMDRWGRLHEASVLEAIGRMESIEAIFDHISQAQKLDSLSAKESAEELDRVYQGLTELLALDDASDHLLRTIDQWQSACDSQILYEQAGMNRIGIETPLIPQVEPNWVIYGSTDLFDALFQLVTSNVTAAENQKQMNIARAAITRYQDLAIHGDEAFEISRKICHTAQAPYLSLLGAIQNGIGKQRTGLIELRKTLNLQRSILEAQVIPSDILRYMESNETLKGLLEIEKIHSKARTETDLGKAKLLLNELIRSLNSTQSCVRKASLLENMEDLMVIVRSQVDQIPDVKLPGWLSQGLPATQAQLKSFDRGGCL